jgi:hypothetical protein
MGSVGDLRPCAELHRDYVRIAAWLFAVSFAPAIVALVTLAVIGVI